MSVSLEPNKIKELPWLVATFKKKKKKMLLIFATYFCSNVLTA